MSETLRAFVFWLRRPVDSRAWPVIYENEQRARECPYRVSAVVPVELTEHAPVNVPEPKT